MSNGIPVLRRTTSVHSKSHAVSSGFKLPQTPVQSPVLQSSNGQSKQTQLFDAKDQKTGIHSGTQKVFAKSGYQQNVTGSVGKCGQIGSKNIGNEGTSTDGKQQPGLNSSGPNDLKTDIVTLMTKLGLGTSVGTAVRTTSLNITRKFYRFASDNSQVFPWSRGTYSSGPPATFSAQLPAMPGRNAYLGSANVANTASPFSTDIAMGGIGFTSTSDTLGGTFGTSNDIAVLLTKIPLVTQFSPTSNSATPNLFARVGPAIYIHRIRGKARIVRQPTQNADLDAQTKAMQLKPPTVISYIQHEPIALQTTQTNFGTIPILIAGQQYPQEGYTAGHSDYVNYCDGDGINNMYGPWLATDAGKTYWEWNRGAKGGQSAGGAASLAYGGPISTDNFKYVHRTPEIQTKIYSHYHRVHELSNSAGTVDGTSSQDYFVDHTADPIHLKDTRQIHPSNEVFEVPIEHEFHGKGLKVVYDQQDQIGNLAGINVLRWRYCQDHTGHLWGYTDNNQTSQNTTANEGTLTMNFQEYMSYEIWVEFSDVPTQL